MATPQTFTVGRDCSAVLISPYGTNITLPLLTQIETTQEYNQVKSMPMNSPSIERPLPMGHRIKVSFDRSGNAVDLLFSQIEAGWWAGGTPDGGTNASASMFIYITETTNGMTTINYTGMSISLTNSGSFSPDAPVKQEISAYAQRKIVS